MHETLRILHGEHVALMALLDTMRRMLAESRERAVRPDFEGLRAMLFYVAEFPEKRHHRQESELLFPKLRARTPLSRTLMEHLEEDHLRGEFRVRALEHILTAFELLGESRRDEFERAALEYIDFYRTHVSLEEREVFPLAEEMLTPDDWDELDAAMTQGSDPLVGREPEDEYRALFERILRHVPLPPQTSPRVAVA